MAILLRLVEQWLEAAVVVEFCPEYASEILENGVSKAMIAKVSESHPEAKEIFKKMTGTFSKFSQRAHCTKTSIRLVRAPGTDSDRLFLTGTMAEKMLHTDALALTIMCLNSVRILLRQFEEAPADWRRRLKQIENQIVVPHKSNRTNSHPTNGRRQ